MAGSDDVDIVLNAHGKMTALNKIYLGDSGIDFIAAALDSGGSGLCAKLLELPLSRGHAYTALPQGISQKRAQQFEVGGIMGMDTRDSWLEGRVISLGATYLHGTLILQDVWGGRPDSPAYNTSQSLKFRDDTYAYYCAPSSGFSRHAIAGAISDVGGYLLIGVFCDYSMGEDQINASQPVDNECLSAIAKNTIEIYVSAYDQEGIVVWQSSEAS